MSRRTGAAWSSASRAGAPEAMHARSRLLSLVAACATGSAARADLALRHDAPAPGTHGGRGREALPIGNGRLGASPLRTSMNARVRPFVLPWRSIACWLLAPSWALLAGCASLHHAAPADDEVVLRNGKPADGFSVTLADFDTSRPMIGDSVVLPRAASPHGPDNRVEAHATLQGALTMKWHDAWYANLRFDAARPLDLRPFLDDGALQIDLEAVDMARAGLTFVMACGPDCERKVPWVVPSRGLVGKGRQHLAIPLRCFVRDGADFSAVTHAFRLDSSGTGEVALSDMRFVRHAKGNVDCPDWRTESVSPRPLEQVWSMDWWMPRHEEKLALIREAAAAHHPIDLVFIGDSITHNWEKAGAGVWARHYAKYNALDLGFGGDHTENVLWRLQHGEIDGFRPKVTVVMIGTNNTGDRQEDPATTAAGVRRILDEIRSRQPDTRILLLAVFPRDEQPTSPLRRLNERLNTILSGYADGRHVFFIDIDAALTNADGTLSRDVMPDLLHPDEKGYEIWASKMEPTLLQLMARP
jgi:beta-glucosidase